MFKPIRSRSFHLEEVLPRSPAAAGLDQLSSLNPPFLHVAAHDEPSEGKVSAFFSLLMHLSLPTPYPVIIS